jgi:peptidoglycan/xylan/chitin deacetylase (PgdA/CDA1 family)
MRRLLKHGAELALVRSGVARAWQRASGRDVVVLAYHNVVPSVDSPVGDSSLHLPLSSFSAQIDALCKTHSVVPLRDLMGAGRRERRPLAAITFDDAYRGALELGLQELFRRGLPATVFVAPGLLGCEGFWWDRVAAPDSGEVAPGLRGSALRDLGGRQDAVLEKASSLGLLHDPLRELYRPATEDLLDAVAHNPLVTLGSHTWGHVDLTCVPRPEAEQELRRSLKWLRARFPSNPAFLSYPYGASREDLGALALEVGYQAGFMVRGGATRLRAMHRNPMAIPRLNVPRGLSPEGLQARISGAWPA